MKEEIKFEVVKFVNNELELEVNVSPNEETIWLSIEEMSILYDVDRSGISRHIKNIYQCNELEKDSTCAKIAHMGILNAQKYVTKIYNLDMVLAVGYRVNSKMGNIFRKWANQVLKEYLLKGYVINENRVVVSNENYIKLSNEVASINNRLIKVENKVLDKDYALNKIFYNGEFYDAYTLIQSIFEKANNEIIIIDNYIDRTILDRLIVKKSNVNVVIYTNSNSSKLLNKDINMFNSQYKGLSIKYTSKVHDRYIIIDNNKLYHLGHSIKDLGKKIFSINELDSSLILMLIQNMN